MKEPLRFKTAVDIITQNGYVTDEYLAVSRTSFKNVTPVDFNEMYERHYPGQESPLSVQSTAIKRPNGDHVNVLFDLGVYEDLKQITAKVLRDERIASRNQ